MADPDQVARSMWTLFEPVHAVTYFAPEARSAFEAARSRLAGRGLIGPEGELTAAGRDTHAAEGATDRAAGRPWARLGPAATKELAGVLTPVAQACAAAIPYPSPIGVPAPGTIT